MSEVVVIKSLSELVKVAKNPEIDLRCKLDTGNCCSSLNSSLSVANIEALNSALELGEYFYEKEENK